MKKLTGIRTKTAIFISGTGTNLKSLIKFSHQKTSPISIDLVISNIKKYFSKIFFHCIRKFHRNEKYVIVEIIIFLYR